MKFELHRGRDDQRQRRWRACAAALIAMCALPAIAQTSEEVTGTRAVTAEARFDIHAFRVKGNALLAPEVVEEAVYPFTGPKRKAQDVEQARAALQKAYEDRGFIAVSVFIPEQSVDSGVLLLEVSQQSIAKVVVKGAHSPDAIRAQASSLAPGQTPNLQLFQRDVVALNRSPNRKVTPELLAGAEPGTLDVVLTVQESSPVHASVELNNFHSTATTDWRASLNLRHDNLWDRGDSLGVSAQTAPERTQDGTVLSANYLTRIGEAQLFGYYVHSDSDIAVVGGTNVLGRGDLAGVHLILPWNQSSDFYQALTLGLDWKSFKEDLRFGQDRDRSPIKYLPATLGWRANWTREAFTSNVSFNTVFGLRGLGDGAERFDYKRYNAKPNFFAVRTEAGATFSVPHELQVAIDTKGQWSADPLISNEGFGLGGMDSVRGYYESEVLGDYGFATQLELRSPDFAAALPAFDELRLHAFYDVGYAGIHQPLVGQDHEWMLHSAGIGGRIKLLKLLSAALDVGVPLVSRPDSSAGSVFVRISIVGDL